MKGSRRWRKRLITLLQAINDGRRGRGLLLLWCSTLVLAILKRVQDKSMKC